MQQNPILFVEINETNFIFVAFRYDNNQNLKIIDKLIVNNDVLHKNKIISINEATNLIKKNIENLENKVNHVFKKVTIVLDTFDSLCINISGNKKLNGSQLLKENISYILNSIKSSITDNMLKKNVLHIFNSKSTLDGTSTENLPIGLFGDFYNHELTFFLIDNNDLKNIKQVFNKNDLEVEKIILKQFCEGTYLIKKHKVESFYKIKFGKNSSYINFFEKESFRFSEKFDFGTDMILKDILRICSIEKESLISILSNKIFNKNVFEKNEFIEEKYFGKNSFRKIKKQLIKDIVDARVEEISNIIFNKNINLKTFDKKNLHIYITIEDQLVSDNFKESFKNFLSNNINTIPNFEDIQDTYNSIINYANISVYGWKKEAIPITQTKNSLITRIFKSLFGS